MNEETTGINTFKCGLCKRKLPLPFHYEAAVYERGNPASANKWHYPVCDECGDIKVSAGASA